MRSYLFADLRDYTVFVETRGDSATARLLRAFRTLARAEVAAHRGSEIKTEGDSFYIVFRGPGAAIRCALGMVERARRHDKRHPDLPLRIGIGINSGEAVELGGGYVGAAVIVAARLAQQAEAGRILVTDTVRALVRTGAIAPMRDLGPWKLRGTDRRSGGGQEPAGPGARAARARRRLLCARRPFACVGGDPPTSHSSRHCGRSLRCADRTSETLGPSGPRAGALARHFAGAGDVAKAIRYARVAAGSAFAVGAYSAAIELLREASGQAAGSPEEGAVLEELGAALQAAGRAPEAEDALSRSRERAVSPADTARIDVRLAGVLRMQGRRAEAAVAVERAIRLIPPAAGEALAEALVTPAALAWADNDIEGTAVGAATALAAARAGGAERIVVRAMTVGGAALARRGDDRGSLQLREAVTRGNVTLGRYVDARAVAEQAVALSRPGTLAGTYAMTTLARVLSMQGEPAAALAVCDRIAPEMERADPDQRANYYGERASALLGVGSLEEAHATVREGIALHRATTGAGVTTFIVGLDVAEARGHPDELAELIESFEAQFAGRDTPTVRVVRQEMHAVLESLRGGDAAAAFEDVAADYAALGVPSRAAFRRASAAMALRAAGRESLRARRMLATARRELALIGARRYLNLTATALATTPPPLHPTSPAPRLLEAAEPRVAALISSGHTDARIARRLRVSQRHVTRLVGRVQEKLGVTTRAQVASWARLRGVAGTVGRP